jgi:hypothetical protein
MFYSSFSEKWQRDGARGQEQAAASSSRGSQLGLGLRLAAAAAARGSGTYEYAGTRHPHPLLEAANSIAINKQRHKIKIHEPT